MQTRVAQIGSEVSGEKEKRNEPFMIHLSHLIPFSNRINCQSFDISGKLTLRRALNSITFNFIHLDWMVSEDFAELFYPFLGVKKIFAILIIGPKNKEN